MKEKKKQLRKQIKEKKQLQCASTLKNWSAEILSKLEQLPVFQEAQTILLYFSMEDEVYTHSFIEKWASRKNILLPVVTGDTLELRHYAGTENLSSGPFGIQEPVGEPFTEYASIDVAIIPGMAFDVLGNRLGRGKGYYDKLLPALRAHTIGVCFPYQLLKEGIPTEECDCPVREVITI